MAMSIESDAESSQPQQSVAVAVAVRVATSPHWTVPGALRPMEVSSGVSGEVVQVIVPPVPSPPGVQVPPPESVTTNPWGTSTTTCILLVDPLLHTSRPEKLTLRS